MIEYMAPSNQKVKYMPIKGKISKVDIIYTAGLIDGEGHIVIEKARRNNPKYKCPAYILMVGCTNTNKQIIEWLFKVFGSSKPLRKRNYGHTNWRAGYEWNVSAIKALKFLETIYPYLRIKKEQAKLAIKFQKEKMAKRKFISSGKLRGNTLSKETLVYRDKIYQQMHFLNTGRHRISPVET